MLATSAAAAPRSKQSKDVTPAAFDDPCLDGTACQQHALDAFHSALATQPAGTADHPLRISYSGDSLTADDHITDVLRKKLQVLVGDGGRGSPTRYFAAWFRADSLPPCSRTICRSASLSGATSTTSVPRDSMRFAVCASVAIVIASGPA